LQAKVDGGVRLWEVFGREGLDFVLFFSSLQSYTKAAGQSNYAAGCTFSDAYAQWLSGRSGGCAIRVMNWGYWGGVGIVASAEYRQRMQQQGIGSIEPAEGMQGLEQLLQGEWPQVSLMKRRVVAGSVLPQWPETIRHAPDCVPRVSVPLAAAVTTDTVGATGTVVAADSIVAADTASLPEESAVSHLQAVLHRLLGQQLCELGVLQESWQSLAQWQEQHQHQHQIARVYRRWLQESLRVLEA